MKLRPYQEDLINKLKLSIKEGLKKLCIVSGCGSGKSVLAGHIARNATAKRNRVLFLVHRKELCEQIQDTFTVFTVNFEYCDIMMVQTASRRLNSLGEYDLIIIDEAHHVLSNSYLRVIEKYNDKIVIGFTATPIRLGDGGLGKVFDKLIEGVKTKWLIDNSFLASYKYYSVKLASLQGLKTKMGDFDKEQISELMEQSRIYGDTLRTWESVANGKKTIIYCSSVRSSLETCQAFQDAGVSVAHLDGNTPKKYREKIIKMFRSGEITVLSNVDLFGEGKRQSPFIMKVMYS